MTNETIKRHAQSAGITFASALGVELLLAMNQAEDWADLGWLPLLSASSFVAARAVLKVFVETLGKL